MSTGSVCLAYKKQKYKKKERREPSSFLFSKCSNALMNLLSFQPLLHSLKRDIPLSLSFSCHSHTQSILNSVLSFHFLCIFFFITQTLRTLVVITSNHLSLLTNKYSFSPILYSFQFPDIVSFQVILVSPRRLPVLTIISRFTSLNIKAISLDDFQGSGLSSDCVTGEFTIKLFAKKLSLLLSMSSLLHAWQIFGETRLLVYE